MRCKQALGLSRILKVVYEITTEVEDVENLAKVHDIMHRDSMLHTIQIISMLIAHMSFVY